MIYLFVLIGIFLCSMSQILLKRSANAEHSSMLFEFVNPLVFVAYAVFSTSLLINIWAMRHGLLLKELTVLESLGYVFVPFLSYIILKERITKRAVCATSIIIIGIIIFYL